MKRRGWKSGMTLQPSYERFALDLELHIWEANGWWWGAINGGASLHAMTPEVCAAKVEAKAAKLFLAWFQKLEKDSKR